MLKINLSQNKTKLSKGPFGHVDTLCRELNAGDTLCHHLSAGHAQKNWIYLKTKHNWAKARLATSTLCVATWTLVTLCVATWTLVTLCVTTWTLKKIKSVSKQSAIEQRPTHCVATWTLVTLCVTTWTLQGCRLAQNRSSFHNRHLFIFFTSLFSHPAFLHYHAQRVRIHVRWNAKQNTIKQNTNKTKNKRHVSPVVPHIWGRDATPKKKNPW